MVDVIVKLVLRLRAHALRTSSSNSEAGSSYCYSTSALCTQHFLCRVLPLFTTELTVDPGFNEPLYNEVLDITSDILRPSEIVKYMERKLDTTKSTSPLALR